MPVNGSGPCQVGPWWRRPGRVAGVAVGLLLVERLLVGEVGSPTALVRTLQDLGDPGADPILSTLALMGLLAEAFVGYLLLVLALRPLATLPGLTGRLARRVTFALAPAVVRRMVDLLVGGALLVQVAVAAPDPSLGHRSERFLPAGGRLVGLRPARHRRASDSGSPGSHPPRSGTAPLVSGRYGTG